MCEEGFAIPIPNSWESHKWVFDSGLGISDLSDLRLIIAARNKKLCEQLVYII